MAKLNIVLDGDTSHIPRLLINGKEIPDVISYKIDISSDIIEYRTDIAYYYDRFKQLKITSNTKCGNCVIKPKFK